MSSALMDEAAKDAMLADMYHQYAVNSEIVCHQNHSYYRGKPTNGVCNTYYINSRTFFAHLECLLWKMGLIRVCL